MTRVQIPDVADFFLFFSKPHFFPHSSTNFQLSPKSNGSYELFTRFKIDLEATFIYLEKILEKNLEDNFLDISDILLEQTSKFLDHLKGVLQSQKRYILKISDPAKGGKFGTKKNELNRKADLTNVPLCSLKSNICYRVAAIIMSLDQIVILKKLSQAQAQQKDYRSTDTLKMSAENLLSILSGLQKDIQDIYDFIQEIISEIKEILSEESQGTINVENSMSNYINVSPSEFKSTNRPCKNEKVASPPLQIQDVQKLTPPIVLPVLVRKSHDNFPSKDTIFERHVQPALTPISPPIRAPSMSYNTATLATDGIRRKNRYAQGPGSIATQKQRERPKSGGYSARQSTYDTYDSFDTQNDPNDQIKFKDGKILYATQSALLDHAIQGNNSNEAAEIWVYTYRSFISAYNCIIALLKKLSDQAGSKRTRTASLLIRVVADLSPYELQNQADLADLLISVIHSLTGEGDITLASKLRKVFINSIKTLIAFPLDNPIENDTLTLKRRSRELIISGGSRKGQNNGNEANVENGNATIASSMKAASALFQLQTENLAHELTMTQQELFSRIEIGELLARAETPNEKDKFPRFTEFVQQFNQVSYRINAIILLQKSKNKRAKAFNMFLEMALILKNMGNFNGMYCVYAALSSNSLSQVGLGHGNGSSSGEYQQYLSEIETLISPNSNYKNYREKINNWKGPYIPWFGAITQQLITITECAKNDLENRRFFKEEGMINFKVLKQKFEAIKPWKHAARASYNLGRCEGSNRLLMDFEIPIYDDLSRVSWGILNGNGNYTKIKPKLNLSILNSTITSASSNSQESSNLRPPNLDQSVNSSFSHSQDIASEHSLSSNDYGDFFWNLASRILAEEKRK